MKDSDDPHQPTAAAAFSRYEEICNLLSTDDMHREVKAIWWDTRTDICLRLRTTGSLTLSQTASDIVFRLRFTSRTVDRKTSNRDVCTCLNCL